jgi:hypothetical protein
MLSDEISALRGINPSDFSSIASNPENFVKPLRKFYEE